MSIVNINRNDFVELNPLRRVCRFVPSIESYVTRSLESSVIRRDYYFRLISRVKRVKRDTVFAFERDCSVQVLISPVESPVRMTRMKEDRDN